MATRFSSADLKGFAASNAVILRGLELSGRLVGWWFTELAGLLPLRLQTLMGVESSFLVIDVTAPRLEVHLWQGRRSEPLGELKLVKAAEQVTNKDPIVARASRVDEVVVRLPEDQVLQREVILPIAAQDNLREVLGFEMDRLTPFECESVAYDYIEEGRDEAEGTLGVRLFVIPKIKLNLFTTKLAALGIRTTAVTIRRSEQSPAAPILPITPNLLEKDPSVRDQSPLRRVTRASWALVLLLAITATLLPVWNQHRHIVVLENAVASLQIDVEASKTLSHQLEKIADDAAFIVARKREEPLAIEYLNELTRALPDGTWLHRFELNSDQISVQGETGNASTVITLMENTNAFADTQFAAPLVRNASTGTERFSIRSKIMRTVSP